MVDPIPSGTGIMETPGFAHPNALEDAAHTQRTREQFISIANMTESEDEVNFYSEGLSNHATSNLPSQFDARSHAQN